MPDIIYSDGGVNRTITEIYYQDGASLRTLTEVYYSDGGTVRKVWPSSTALSATASPSSLSGFTLNNAAVSSDSTTVTPVGGTGGITYLWEYVSGDTFTVSSPTGSTTDFVTTIPTPGGTKTGVYRCQVTSGAEVVYTNNVTIFFERAV